MCQYVQWILILWNSIKRIGTMKKGMLEYENFLGNASFVKVGYPMKQVLDSSRSHRLFSINLYNRPTLTEQMRSPPDISVVRDTRSVVLFVMLCRSLFVLLYFFVWSLCCLFVFDLWDLSTPLVSSNYS